ncbi:MAG: phosphoribosyltransferase, partial [Verrucomicrobiota bacterium]
MTFASREDAGQKLGGNLHERGLETEVVLGLPRGGVVVAAEVARILHRPLDVLVVRKIGHPFHREFAVGA